MTTTTDLLREIAQHVREEAESLRESHGHFPDRDPATMEPEVREVYDRELSYGAALDALADQMERVEPVAWVSPHTGALYSHDQIGRSIQSGNNHDDWTPCYTHPAPEVTHPLEHLLPELCQLLDAFKREAENNGEGWTEWDESVRARLRKCIAEHNIAAMQELKP